jgi:very-short-patch-repair endonuclease
VERLTIVPGFQRNVQRRRNENSPTRSRHVRFGQKRRWRNVRFRREADVTIVSVDVGCRAHKVGAGSFPDKRSEITPDRRTY